MAITTVYRGGDSAPVDAELLKFRLYYDGRLYSTRNKPEPGQIDRRAPHKHEIRRRFHRQLSALWNSHPSLREWMTEIQGKRGTTILEDIARKYTFNKFRWAPLVRHDIGLHCCLNILYLRPGAPFVLSHGDLDNRAKTIIDALKMPQAGELDPAASPGDGEDPFFVLLDDDASVSELRAEADTLFERTDPQLGDNDSRVIITVELRKFRPSWLSNDLV